MRLQCIIDWLSAIQTTSYKYVAMLWTGLTLYLSVASADSMRELDIWSIVGIDKVGHAGFYAVFAFLWMMASRNHKTSKHYIMILTIGFGILMEIAQYSMRVGRAFEVYDILANVTGCIIGYWLFSAVMKNTYQ